MKKFNKLNPLKQELVDLIADEKIKEGYYKTMFNTGRYPNWDELDMLTILEWAYNIPVFLKIQFLKKLISASSGKNRWIVETKYRYEKKYFVRYKNILKRMKRKMKNSDYAKYVDCAVKIAPHVETNWQLIKKYKPKRLRAEIINRVAYNGYRKIQLIEYSFKDNIIDYQYKKNNYVKAVITKRWNKRNEWDYTNYFQNFEYYIDGKKFTGTVTPFNFIETIYEPKI